LAFYFLFDIRNGATGEVSKEGLDPFFPYGEEVFEVLRGN
jgi:hypothetical protein